MRVCVESVGVLGAGLSSWPITREILRGKRPYCYEPAAQPNPDILPATERRRGAKSVRWAVAAAQEAVAASGLAVSELATVFTSSGGDGETLHHICEALAAPGREISPTRFHNSVHNAAAGYWSIAAASRGPSVSLCGYDASFGVGLLEAASQVSIDRLPVLLVAYDLPYPQPLFALRPISEPFAVAFVFTAERCPETLACWHIAIAKGEAPSPLSSELAQELGQNPAGRALPLLAALARGAAEPVYIEYLDGRHLVVEPVC
jgi:hypothetical protein